MDNFASRIKQIKLENKNNDKLILFELLTRVLSLPRITYKDIKELKQVLGIKGSNIVTMLCEYGYKFKLYEVDLPDSFSPEVPDYVVMDILRNKVKEVDSNIQLNKFHNDCEIHIKELNELHIAKNNLKDPEVIKKHVPIEMRIIAHTLRNNDDINTSLVLMSVANLQ